MLINKTISKIKEGFETSDNPIVEYTNFKGILSIFLSVVFILSMACYSIWLSTIILIVVVLLMYSRM